MNNRILSADEISRILKNHVYKPDFTYALGENFRAVRQSAQSGLVFQLERNGAVHPLAEATADERWEISEILRTRRIGYELEWAAEDLLTPDLLREKKDDPTLEPDPLGLTPDALREKIDPLAGTLEGLMPENLRDVPDDPNLEPDPTGLCPDWARQTKADAARARRIADGTATVEDLLRPDYLRDDKDIKPPIKTPTEKESDGQKEVRITLAEWIEKQKGNAEKISIQE